MVDMLNKFTNEELTALILECANAMDKEEFEEFLTYVLEEKESNIKEDVQENIINQKNELYSIEKDEENNVEQSAVEVIEKEKVQKDIDNNQEITYINLEDISDDDESSEDELQEEDNNNDYDDFEIEDLDVKHKISYIRNRGKVLHLKKGLVIKKRKRTMVHTMVHEGPENYIDPLCVTFCERLWDKNVYTKDVKVTDKKVLIVLDKLSDENKSLYENSKNTSLIKKDDKYVINIDREGRSALLVKNMLSKTVNRFVMQDVKTGYLDKEKFLMHFCNCEKVDGLSENGEANGKIKIIFDENKMEKTFEEYLKDKNLDKLYSKDNDRIYIDEYYLKGHLKYLEYMSDKK